MAFCEGEEESQAVQVVRILGQLDKKSFPCPSFRPLAERGSTLVLDHTLLSDYAQ